MNQKQIARVLRESIFSPKKPGPMQIIADVGDIDYYVNRSLEILLNLENKDANLDFHLKNTISLLALARVKLNEETKPS